MANEKTNVTFNGEVDQAFGSYQTYDPANYEEFFAANPDVPRTYEEAYFRQNPDAPRTYEEALRRQKKGTFEA